MLCCDHSSEILDEAAIEFTRSFYMALTDGYTIKHAYQAGKGAVSVRYGTVESNKFILIPHDENHDVPVFDAIRLEWSEERESVNDKRIPSPVNFYGRKTLMYSVISTIISNQQLLSLVGEEGIGRSSVVLAVCRYIQDRMRSLGLFDSIFYVKKAMKASEDDLEGSLLKPLHEQLIDTGMAKPSNEESLLHLVCNALRTQRALIVFDDVDGMEDQLHYFLSNLFDKAPSVTTIMVTQKPINFSSGAVVGACIYVEPLETSDAANLFDRMCAFSDNRDKEKKLSTILLSDKFELSVEGSYFDNLVDIVRKGNPSNIVEAAKQLSKEEYSKIMRFWEACNSYC